jgi:hypothetical protein
MGDSSQPTQTHLESNAIPLGLRVPQRERGTQWFMWAISFHGQKKLLRVSTAQLAIPHSFDINIFEAICEKMRFAYVPTSEWVFQA